MTNKDEAQFTEPTGQENETGVPPEETAAETEPTPEEALRGELAVAEIAGKYQVHLDKVQQWKKKLMEGASEIFQSKAERKENKPYTEDDLMKKIGRLEIENDFLRSVSLACGLNPEKLK